MSNNLLTVKFTEVDFRWDFFCLGAIAILALVLGLDLFVLIPVKTSIAFLRGFLIGTAALLVLAVILRKVSPKKIYYDFQRGDIAEITDDFPLEIKTIYQEGDRVESIPLNLVLLGGKEVAVQSPLWSWGTQLTNTPRVIITHLVVQLKLEIFCNEEDLNDTLNFYSKYLIHLAYKPDTVAPLIVTEGKIISWVEHEVKKKVIEEMNRHAGTFAQNPKHEQKREMEECLKGALQPFLNNRGIRLQGLQIGVMDADLEHIFFYR